MNATEQLHIGMIKTQAEVMARETDTRRAYVNANPRNIVLVNTRPSGSKFIEMWEGAGPGHVDRPDMPMRLMAAFTTASWNFDWMQS
jgi:hypothetical protein